MHSAAAPGDVAHGIDGRRLAISFTAVAGAAAPGAPAFTGLRVTHG